MSLKTFLRWWLKPIIFIVVCFAIAYGALYLMAHTCRCGSVNFTLLKDRTDPTLEAPITAIQEQLIS